MPTIMDTLIEMRLVIEGTVSLFEKKPDCFSDEYCLIGEALYLVRDKVNDCLKTLQNGTKGM